MDARIQGGVSCGRSPPVKLNPVKKYVFAATVRGIKKWTRDFTGPTSARFGSVRFGPVQVGSVLDESIRFRCCGNFKKVGGFGMIMLRFLMVFV